MTETTRETLSLETRDGLHRAGWPRLQLYGPWCKTIHGALSEFGGAVIDFAMGAAVAQERRSVEAEAEFEIVRVDGGWTRRKRRLGTPPGGLS